MLPTSRRIPGYAGLSLHLLEWSAEGPPLLLVHGFGHSARVWDPFVATLATRYRTLALDLRGHGESQHDPEFRYAHSAVARDLACVADHLELERFTLVAHSMGGYAAIRYAARHPARLARLVLVDAGPELSASSRAARGQERLDAAHAGGYADPAAYAAVLARMYPRAQPEALAELARHWLRERPDGRYEPKLDPTFVRPKSVGDPANRRSFDRERWALEESQRLWRCLGDIPCPTLVLRGEHSPMLSRETLARMANEALPDGRAIEIPGAGHALPLDAPAGLDAALREFLLGPAREGGSPS